MSRAKALTDWQTTLPAELPHHIKRSIEHCDNDCWLWTRSKSRDGYGWTSLNNKTYQAHRLVYRLLRGDPPEGLHLDHLCRVRHCVNPEHLEPVTPRVNLERGETLLSADVCSKGHPLTFSHGQRRCLPCAKDRRRQRREGIYVYRKDGRDVVPDGRAVPERSAS